MGLRKLSDLIGNRRVLDLLRKGGLPSSLIFSGPDGVGKKSAAVLLATYRNCRAPAAGDLCGTCSSCTKALSDNHPDIRLVSTDEATIKVDMIRSLNQEVQYRPFEGKSRYFVVDEAERMTLEAANSLLKTLEEPPPTSHLILITAYPQKLLPTIRSRCQNISFQSIDYDDLAAFLALDPELKNPELRARFSEGRIGKALTMDIEALLADRDQMLRLLTDWLTQRRFQLVYDRMESDALRAKIKKREETARLLELLELLCYDLYYLLIDAPDRIVNIDRRPQLQALTSRVSTAYLGGFLDKIGQSRLDLEHYVKPLMAFDAIWLEDLRGSRR